MTVLNRFYTSSGREVELHTLQITVGEDAYCFVRGWDDITAITESGESVAFTACGMDVALPARNADGTQDLNFALSNITGVVSERIGRALDNKEAMQVTYRNYLSTDLGAPASNPTTMAVKGGYWNKKEVQFTSGYVNVLDRAFNRNFYTLNNHPGLRYF